MAPHPRPVRRGVTWMFLSAAMAACVATVSAQGRFVAPAAFSGGGMPSFSPLIVGGGEVFAEVTVGVSGAVTSVKMLRETRPFADALGQALRGWTFRPAEEETTSASGEKTRTPVASKVFVAGMFRAPAIMGPTLGEVPKDVSPAAAEVPFPTLAIMPTYPPAAIAPGMVIVEVRVAVNGRVSEAKIVRSDAAFDAAALDSARKWTFRSARIRGSATPVLAYLLFSFRPPIT